MVKFSNMRYNYCGGIMKMLDNNASNELIIKNSKFICLLYILGSVDEVEKFLEDSKVLYPRATHYCYAYIFNGLKRANDDGEPVKTAGIPILNILEHEQLENVLCVVVRYFGGVKLGTGGLVRAYSKSVRECLKKVKLKEIVEGYLIEIFISYEQIRELDYLLSDSYVLDKKFLEKVVYRVKVEESILDFLDNKGYCYRVIGNCYISKDKTELIN